MIPVKCSELQREAYNLLKILPLGAKLEMQRDMLSIIQSDMCFWKSIKKSFEKSEGELVENMCLFCNGKNTECRGYCLSEEKKDITIIKKGD